MEWPDLRKKRSRFNRFLIIFAVLVAGLLTGTAAFGYIYFTQDNNSDDPGSISSPIDEETGEPVKLDKRVSVLLVGADKRPGDTTYNADTLIVASVDPDTNIISLLSIPRDTRITLNSDPFVKINSVVMYKGINELVRQVEDLTGISLDGYVVTNFDGFKGIIDTLGGIDIYVEKDMYWETGDKVDGVIDLKQGQQRLDGSKALQYARYRNDELADIGRTARQQKVIKAVIKEALQPSTIPKLPQLLSQAIGMVETNLKLKDMLTLAKAAASFDSSNVVSLTLPGAGIYLDHISFWEVNRTIAKETVHNLLLGITTDRVFSNAVVDLLDPSIRAHLTVPGSSKDPNGTASPGHENREQQEPPNQEGSGSDEQDTEEPGSNDNDSEGTDQGHGQDGTEPGFDSGDPDIEEPEEPEGMNEQLDSDSEQEFFTPTQINFEVIVD